MTKSDKIKEFISQNTDTEITSYADKLYESLRDLNQKEEKHVLWFVIVTFLYMISGSSSMQSINLGFITINDISVISKILPIVLTYIVVNMYLISIHKKDVMLALNLISEKRFKQIPLDSKTKEFSRNFIIKIFFPFSFSNSISIITFQKPTISQAIIGIVLLFPVILLALTPYIISILMLIDLYKNYTNDYLGWICFLGSIWGFLLLIFYMWINAKDEA